MLMTKLVDGVVVRFDEDECWKFLYGQPLQDFEPQDIAFVKARMPIPKNSKEKGNIFCSNPVLSTYAEAIIFLHRGLAEKFGLERAKEYLLLASRKYQMIGTMTLEEVMDDDYISGQIRSHKREEIEKRISPLGEKLKTDFNKLSEPVKRSVIAGCLRVAQPGHFKENLHLVMVNLPKAANQDLVTEIRKLCGATAGVTLLTLIDLYNICYTSEMDDQTRARTCSDLLKQIGPLQDEFDKSLENLSSKDSEKANECLAQIAEINVAPTYKLFKRFLRQIPDSAEPLLLISARSNGSPEYLALPGVIRECMAI